VSAPYWRRGTSTGITLPRDLDIFSVSPVSCSPVSAMLDLALTKRIFVYGTILPAAVGR